VGIRRSVGAVVLAEIISGKNPKSWTWRAVILALFREKTNLKSSPECGASSECECCCASRKLSLVETQNRVGCVASPKLNRLAGATLGRLVEVSSPTLLDFRCSAWLEKKVVFPSPKVTMTNSYIMSRLDSFFCFVVFYDLCLHVGLPDNSFWG